MTLKVLLPFQVFLEKPDVSRIVAEGRNGSFGLLPNRLDCVAVCREVWSAVSLSTDRKARVLTIKERAVLVESRRLRARYVPAATRLLPS